MQVVLLQRARIDEPGHTPVAPHISALPLLRRRVQLRRGGSRRCGGLCRGRHHGGERLRVLDQALPPLLRRGLLLQLGDALPANGRHHAGGAVPAPNSLGAAQKAARRSPDWQPGGGWLCVSAKRELAGAQRQGGSSRHETAQASGRAAPRGQCLTRAHGPSPRPLRRSGAGLRNTAGALKLVAHAVATGQCGSLGLLEILRRWPAGRRSAVPGPQETLSKLARARARWKRRGSQLGRKKPNRCKALHACGACGNVW